MISQALKLLVALIFLIVIN